MHETIPDTGLIGHVAWDGSTATSEHVLLRGAMHNRAAVERNQFVRIRDDEGKRTGFLAKITSGPFFHRPGTPTVGGLTAGASAESYMLAELEIQGEFVNGRLRDTNSRPIPGATVHSLSNAELADIYGFRGNMILGNLAGQDDLLIHLQSKNKGVLPRNLGIFGTVGSGKTNTAQVIMEEAARNGWAVIILDVEGEYVDMDMPADEPDLERALAKFGLLPQGFSDFRVFHPASCASDKATSEPFTLRLADFDATVIAEILQVSMPERNALMDCLDHLQQKAKTKIGTSETDTWQNLLDASPQAKSPFTLRSVRERAVERSARSTEFFDFTGLAAKLTWLLQSEAFDLINMRSLDAAALASPGRINIIDVSYANDVVKNLVTADLLRKIFVLKMSPKPTPPTLLLIEEAHSFISRERAQTMQATLHMLRNVMRRGRKRWLSLGYVSQQPGHLPPEVFELCNTRIVHALRSTHNLEALMATTGDVGRDLWARCPLLGQGQALLSSPQLARSVILSVRPAASRRKFTR